MLQQEVFVLNPTTYKIDDIVMEYDTLRWTERYFNWGDMAMTFTKDLKLVLYQLPIGSMITHLRTETAMWVSTHSIETDENGLTTLTISGKSVDSFLDYRISAPWSAQQISAAYTAVNIRASGRKSWPNPPALPTGYTADNTGSMPERLYLASGASYAALAANTLHVFLDVGRDPVTVIPNLLIDNIAVSPTAAPAYYVPRGQLGPIVRDMLNGDDLGIRYKRTEVSDPNGRVRLQIYSGVDRSLTTVLREDMGFFSKISYLNTEEGAVHGVHMFTNLYRQYKEQYGISSMSAIRKRLFLVNDDGRVPWIDPGSTPNGSVLSNTLSAVSDAALRDGYPKPLFEVRISDQEVASGKSSNPALRFDLGDKITFNTVWGGNQIMRITEQTLIWDRDVGVVQYMPAFEMVV